MHRVNTVVPALLLLFAPWLSAAAPPGLEPIHILSGNVLTFYLQTRLNPGSQNELDSLPKGTALQVKILENIDSDVDRDGTEFHGSLVSAIVSGNEVVVHADAEIRGLLVLLRSTSRPKGFRYELLITGGSDHGKLLALTASLNPSFSVPGGERAPSAKPIVRQDSPSTEQPKVPVRP